MKLMESTKLSTVIRLPGNDVERSQTGIMRHKNLRTTEWSFILLRLIGTVEALVTSREQQVERKQEERQMDPIFLRNHR